jgi:rhodanese-related sulfurtransferase
MKLKILLLLLTLGLFVIQFASAQDTTRSSIDQKKFDKMMKKKNTVALDVRTPEEYSAGYIGQAINYNVLDSLNFVKTISSLDKNKKYLLYCKSGRRSGKALLMMKNMGFRKVYHLRGGVTNWKGDLNKPAK